VVHICNFSYSASRGRRITVQGWPRQKHETLSEKQIKIKRTRNMTQMIDCSLSKPKPLSSIPSMAKKKKK
jgi:hypothetical protein